jgi:tetratricopeptide (TPR) repeat protein
MTEYGVDSVIVKPVSVNSLIQKIALAIKPNTGFQRKVEKVRELIEQKNFAAAQEGIDALLDEKPDSSIALILKGDIARLQKDTELAASCYQQASEYSKLYLKPLERLVALYHETGDQENLLRYLLKMDQLSPMNYTRKIDIGQTYTDLGEKEKSEKFFSQAIKIVKDEANDMLASTLMDIGRKVREKDQDAAVRYMNDALDLKQSQPAIDDLWMYNELGLTFRQRGEWQNAVQTYEKALRIAPNDGGVHYNLAMAYAQGRDYRKAAEHAKQAEQHSSMLAETPAAAFNMASIYVKTAQKERAAKLLKSCLQGDPAHKGAKELLKKLSADF